MELLDNDDDNGDLCEALLVLAVVDIRGDWVNNSWPTLNIHHDVERLVPGDDHDDDDLLKTTVTNIKIIIR